MARPLPESLKRSDRSCRDRARKAKADSGYGVNNQAATIQNLPLIRSGVQGIPTSARLVEVELLGNPVRHLATSSRSQGCLIRVASNSLKL
jgi:hypothetical protein